MPHIQNLFRLLIILSLALSVDPSPGLALPTTPPFARGIAAQFDPFGPQAVVAPLGSIRNQAHHGFSVRFAQMAEAVRRMNPPAQVSTLRGLSRAERGVWLRRHHWFEFNDQPWVHEIVRSMITFSAAQTFVEAGAGNLMGEVLAALVRESGAKSILELAAGSAIPSVELSNELHDRGLEVPYLISDMNPDFGAFRRASKSTHDRIQFIDHPIDMLDIPPALVGLRVMVTSFHHLRPKEAQRVLGDASARGIPIAIFELTDRRLLNTILIGPLGFVLMLLRLKAFVKIHKVHPLPAIFWGVLAAIAFGWDGLVSCLRSYTPNELKLMTWPLSDGYRWRIDTVKTAIPGVRITCLTGSAA